MKPFEVKSHYEQLTLFLSVRLALLFKQNIDTVLTSLVQVLTFKRFLLKSDGLMPSHHYLRLIFCLLLSPNYFKFLVFYL